MSTLSSSSPEDDQISALIAENAVFKHKLRALEKQLQHLTSQLADLRQTQPNPASSSSSPLAEDPDPSTPWTPVPNPATLDADGFAPGERRPAGWHLAHLAALSASRLPAGADLLGYCVQFKRSSDAIPAAALSGAARIQMFLSGLPHGVREERGADVWASVDGQEEFGFEGVFEGYARAVARLDREEAEAKTGRWEGVAEPLLRGEFWRAQRRVEMEVEKAAERHREFLRRCAGAA